MHAPITHLVIIHYWVERNLYCNWAWSHFIFPATISTGSTLCIESVSGFRTLLSPQWDPSSLFIVNPSSCLVYLIWLHPLYNLPCTFFPFYFSPAPCIPVFFQVFKITKLCPTSETSHKPFCSRMTFFVISSHQPPPIRLWVTSSRGLPFKTKCLLSYSATAPCSFPSWCLWLSTGKTFNYVGFPLSTWIEFCSLLLINA